MTMNLSGQTLGPYQIIEQLGQGGMATVYKGYQSNMDRYVAIKILPQILAQDPNFVGRFEQEAKTIAKLEHARILPVYDYGEVDGITYIVMRFLDAGTLAERIRDGGPMPLAEAGRIVSQVSEGLDYAHSRGVIHRDIKPANIMLDSSGDAYITDFGIAKLVEGTAQFTGSGIVGTPAYVSPEQGLGQPLDARSDVYAMGIVLYEMLTGRTPYEAETPMAVIVKHINEPLPSPTQINPSISPDVEAVVLKALAKRPDERYTSCGEMAATLRAVLAGESPPHRAPTAAPSPTRAVEAAPKEGTARVPLEDAGTIPVKAAAAPDATPEEIHIQVDLSKKNGKKKTNWLLIGGIAIGVICLCLFLLAVASRAGNNAKGTSGEDGKSAATEESAPAPGKDEPPPEVPGGGNEPTPLPEHTPAGEPTRPQDVVEHWMACPEGQIPVFVREFTPGGGDNLPPGAEITTFGEDGFSVLRLTASSGADPVILPFGEEIADSTLNALFVLPAGPTDFGVHSRVSQGRPGYGVRFGEGGMAQIVRGPERIGEPARAPGLDVVAPHVVSLRTMGNHIEVFLDGRPLLGADDPEPLPPGRFMVEVRNGVVLVGVVAVCAPGEGPPPPP